MKAWIEVNRVAAVLGQLGSAGAEAARRLVAGRRPRHGDEGPGRRATADARIDGGRGEAAWAIRGAMAARHATRGGMLLAPTTLPGEAPGVRYLYDEDGRILAEAVVGPGKG